MDLRLCPLTPDLSHDLKTLKVYRVQKNLLLACLPSGEKRKLSDFRQGKKQGKKEFVSCDQTLIDWSINFS